MTLIHTRPLHRPAAVLLCALHSALIFLFEEWQGAAAATSGVRAGRGGMGDCPRCRGGAPASRLQRLEGPFAALVITPRQCYVSLAHTRGVITIHHGMLKGVQVGTARTIVL